MNEINLSYVITTRNKLPYLKQVMIRLLANVREDEEIIVIDGCSSDGTVEYLQDLYQQGKIHQFVSEPDKGEAHGYNKGFLMARGKLIKDITDDDAYYYPAIQECKKFMLEHETIDVMNGNIAQLKLENLDKIYKVHQWQSNFDEWFINGNPVSLSGLPLMIRRSSLALVGLYSVHTMLVDLEFTYRITSLSFVNLAWNNALICTRIDNHKSNFRKLNDKELSNENQRISGFYDKKHRQNFYKKKIAQSINNAGSYIKKTLFKKDFKVFKPAENKEQSILFIESEDVIAKAFEASDRYMTEYNQNHDVKIVWKK